MALQCCVGNCNATSATHRLFSMPKNDKLRSLWMSFLVPTNPYLLGLSKETLLKKRVCEKHFDKQQFDNNGQRLRYSYPCLISDLEIAHGVPLAEAGGSVLDEHNYCNVQYENEDDVTEATVVILKPNELEHPSCSNAQSSVMENRGSNLVQMATRITYKAIPAPVEKPVLQSHIHSGAVETVPLTPTICHKILSVQAPASKGDSQSAMQKQNSLMKKLGSKRRKFIRYVTKVTTDSMGDSSSQRLTQAQTESKKDQLFKNFDKLTKQQQSFLMMQLKLCRKNKMARRFTLDDKLIALALYKQSPKGYKLLERMFALPSKRTLNRLSEKISIEPGLNPKIFKYIKDKTKNWDTKQKLTTIVFDEIALSPHLTFNEKSDAIQGFVDIAGERKLKYCDHALVFMLRGLCSSWRQSVAYYFCEGTVSAVDLKKILKQLVSQVAQSGLIPLGLVCDQGSTFRTALKSFREETIRTRNIQGIRDDGTIDIAGPDLSIFYDPPHLLKGIRNNFLTKDLKWDGKTASWKDIQFIHDLDSKLGHTRALPRLTAHHVDPKKIKKMKVSVAAQVLSARTAAMLKYTNALNIFHNAKPSTMAETAEIVEFFDNLFDSVNGYPGGSVRGKLRKAVKKNSPHEQYWRDAIKKIKSMKFEDFSSKFAVQAGKPRLIRVPSLDGWVTTLESFIRISKLLFEKYGVEFYYPRNVNQDPLENFFGRIRAINYRNVNPDANTFVYSFKSLILSNVLSPHSKFANCEEDAGDTLLDINFLFEEGECNKENTSPNISATPSSSQQLSESNLRTQVMTEKIQVHCSAYTAGFISRKLNKAMKCKSCLGTHTSRTESDIHKLITFREYTSLKNKNLEYPNESFLMLYRDASQYIHNYLNFNCYKKAIGSDIKNELQNTMRYSWLGCAKHKTNIINVFIKVIIRLHVHNWCNIINKIFKGDIEQKYVAKMANPQIMAHKKYVSLKLRKKTINK